jgi:hypothetical protein
MSQTTINKLSGMLNIFGSTYKEGGNTVQRQAVNMALVSSVLDNIESNKHLAKEDRDAMMVEVVANMRP